MCPSAVCLDGTKCRSTRGPDNPGHPSKYPRCMACKKVGLGGNPAHAWKYAMSLGMARISYTLPAVGRMGVASVAVGGGVVEWSGTMYKLLLWSRRPVNTVCPFLVTSTVS